MGNRAGFRVYLLVFILILAAGFSFGCRKWSNPSSLADNISPDLQDATNPQVAMNATGYGVVVWEQSDSINSQIYKSEFVNGAWTNTKLTDNISPAGRNAYSPRIAINAAGYAVIVWTQLDGLNFRIFKSERTNGVWTNPYSLSDSISPAGTDAYYPRAAINGNGDILITWHQFDGTSYQVFKSEKINGTWVNPTSLTANICTDGSNAYYPVAAMNDNNEALVVWEQTDGVNYQIFKSEKRNGIWKNPSSIKDDISPDSTDAYYPQAAMNSTGDAIITWEQFDGFRYQTFFSRYTTGEWIHPASVSDNISPDAGNAYYPQVVMNDKGSAVITWEQEVDNGLVRIFKSDLRSGKWSHPRNVTDSLSIAGTSAWLPQAAMDSAGNAIITWYQSDADGKFQIFKSEYSASTRMDSPFMQWSRPSGLTDNISPDFQDAKVPQPAMSDSGNAVIVWQQSDGAKTQIFKSEYLNAQVSVNP
jgi:hypothetical protein